MARSTKPLPGQPCELQVHRLRFIREHDGTPERALKGKLVELFGQGADVQRAYLVEISSGGQSSVALCIKSRQAPDQNLVREVGAVFAALFVREEHLDILFLNESQESALRKVCAPFYAVSSPTR